MKYRVDEFAAGRWYAVRTFNERAEAEAFAKQIGHKTRVVEVVRGTP